MQTNGNGYSTTKKKTVIYDKGFGEAFRLKKHCTWSVYQIVNGSYNSQQCIGVYLHTLCDND
jgi:hypothetical protein